MDSGYHLQGITRTGSPSLPRIRPTKASWDPSSEGRHCPSGCLVSEILLPLYPPRPSSPPPILSPAAAWAQHQDKRCLTVHPPGPTLQGWSRVVLKEPNTTPLPPRKGSPGVTGLGGRYTPLWLKRPVWAGKDTILPLDRTRHPPLLHIFCVWPLCRLERERGGYGLAEDYGNSQSSCPLVPQALEANPGILVH